MIGIGLAVLIVAVVALREPNGHVAAAQTGQPSGASNIARNSTPPQSTKSTSSAPRTSDSHASFKVKDVPLIVLNNTTTTGLAAQAAQRFEGGGWTVTSVSNYQNSILSTCAYYDPAVTGAKAAATALQRQYPTIKRVAPRFAPDPGAEPLPAGPIVVVLTPDYSAA